MYHGLEIRKQLGTLANVHAMVQELHSRRPELAEVQHVSYLRHRLNEAMTLLQDLQASVDGLHSSPGSSTGASNLPIVRLAIPDGTEMQLL